MVGVMKLNSNEILIKKYANRRLYNSDKKEYVTLKDIAGLIRKGSDIRVVDTGTNEDITRQILGQIIMEEEKNNKEVLPTSLLYRIIRSNEEIMKDFFENYLNQTIDNYILYRKAVDKKLKEMNDINRLPFEMTDIFMKNAWNMPWMNPFDGKK